MRRILIASVLPALLTAGLVAVDGEMPSDGAHATASSGVGGASYSTYAEVHNDQLSSQDKDFIANAGSGGTFEIESSRYALKHGLNGYAATIAEIMLNDHQVMANHLAAILDTKGVTAPDDLNDADAKLFKQLKKTPDDQLGKAYMDAQVAAHEEAIAVFTGEVEHGRDAELRAFAASNLPVLRKHLAHVQPMQ